MGLFNVLVLPAVSSPRLLKRQRLGPKQAELQRGGDVSIEEPTNVLLLSSQETAKKRTPECSGWSGQESGGGPSGEQSAQQEPVLQQLSSPSHPPGPLKDVTGIHANNRTYRRAAAAGGCCDFSIPF